MKKGFSFFFVLILIFSLSANFSFSQDAETSDTLKKAMEAAEAAQKLQNYDDLTDEQKTALENGEEISLPENSEKNENVESRASSSNAKGEKKDASKDEKTKTETKKTGKSTVKIINAQKTEYAKNAEGNDVIVLTGSVKLSVEQDGKTTIVSADRVVYDRARSEIFAEGSVALEKMSGDKVTESITADTVLFNSDTNEGVFNNGRVVQSGDTAIKLEGDSSLVVESELFGRDSSGVVGFKKGSFTFCDEDDPHWKIKASRIWLLPGNEFAFLNAVFRIGNIPILWLPFFYYPKDEMIFNPVLGFDKRKGYFLNTSTYIIGRKKSASTNSSSDSSSSSLDNVFSFLDSASNKKQVREGLFLHNTDEEETNTSSNFLRVMADYYTLLGGMVGVDGKFAPNKVLTDINFAAMFGFTNTVFKTRTGTDYTVYDWTNDNKTSPDYGYVFGAKIPFRFYANLGMTINYSPVSFSLSVPLYTDPYFNSDFMTDRKESMNFLSLLTNGLVDKKDQSTLLATGIGSYTWLATLSVNPKITALNPYVSTMSLSGVKSSILFSNKTNSALTGMQALYNPNRKFFYVSQIVPGSGTFTVSGTLVSYSSSNAKAKEKKASGVNKLVDKMIKPSIDDDGEQNVDEAGTDGAQEKNSDTSSDTSSTATSASVSQNASASASEDDIYSKSFNQSLALSSYKESTQETVSYNLSYSIAPSVDSLMTYNSDKATSPDDFHFSEEYFQSTYYKVYGTASLNSRLSLYNSAISMTNDVKFSPSYQQHPYISDEYYKTQDARDQIVLNDYGAHSLDVINTNSVSVRPFFMVPIIDASTLSWNTTIKFIDTKFSGTVQNPSWDYRPVAWNKDSITSHNLNFNLAAKVNIVNQALSFTANLPPQTASYILKYSLAVPFLNFYVESGFEELEKDSSGNVIAGKHINDYKVKPFKQGLNFTFFDSKLTFAETFQYDIENNNAETLTISATAWGATVSYSMQYTTPYNLDKQKGWVAETDKKFVPSSLAVSYNLPSKKYRWWKNRISFEPGLSTSITVDMIKPTKSYFIFAPSISFEINQMLTFTFTATSRNDVIFRYFQGMYNYDTKVPGETNIFKDLFYSFDFGNPAHRQASGFKLKSLAFALTHDLHDWNLKCEFKIEPRLLTDKIPYRYDFSPYFTLSVIWKPMSTFKAKIQDEYGVWSVNPDTER